MASVARETLEMENIFGFLWSLVPFLYHFSVPLNMGFHFSHTAWRDKATA
jgi:hypothetical protein